MNNAISHITLNNKRITFTDSSILLAEKRNNPFTPEWEKELYLFLNEWFSDSDFVLAQTSGSTGEPKSIELPKSLMVKSAERTIQYFRLQRGDRLLLSLPCRYIAGKMMVVRAIVGQMNLIPVDPAGDFDFLSHELFDFGAMVPNQVFKLLQQPSGKEKLENIRNLLVGGSAITSATEAQINQLSNRIVSTYGMTETASHIAIRELSGERKSDVYRCLPGITISLSEDRRLQIHLPELNEITQTNDFAELQSETSFRIYARADSVLISGGIKYSPEGIEKKLEDIMISRFVISSLPDEKLGEKLVLVIEGKYSPADLIQQKIKNLLPPFEQPKSIVFLETFPETDSGKLNRNKIKLAILIQQKQQ
jgi:O-succinylbenzoic acid--CoA ligase